MMFGTKQLPIIQPIGTLSCEGYHSKKRMKQSAGIHISTISMSRKPSSATPHADTVLVPRTGHLEQFPILSLWWYPKDTTSPVRTKQAL